MNPGNATSAKTRGKIVIGISSCLLGQKVRYDGGRKRDSYINDTLSEYFEFFPVCPEVTIGLATRRPPIRLTHDQRGVRVLGINNPSEDYTDALRAHGEKMAAQLRQISGYIFKRGSPSCDIERVKVYG